MLNQEEYNLSAEYDAGENTVSDEVERLQWSVPLLIQLIARMAKIMAEEADHLETLKVHKIRDLQEHKLLVAQALERAAQALRQNPHIVRQASMEDMQDLQRVIQIFDEVKFENHRRLMIAKEINQSVVDAIADVVTDYNASMIYDHSGTSDAMDTVFGKPLSVTLDQKI